MKRLILRKEYKLFINAKIIHLMKKTYPQNILLKETEKEVRIVILTLHLVDQMKKKNLLNPILLVVDSLVRKYNKNKVLVAKYLSLILFNSLLELLMDK